MRQWNDYQRLFLFYKICTHPVRVYMHLAAVSQVFILKLLKLFFATDSLSFKSIPVKSAQMLPNSYLVVTM